MPVSEARKKAYAWTELLSTAVTDSLVSPLTRVRTMWVAAPAMMKTGLCKVFTSVDPLTYTAVVSAASQPGYSRLFISATVMGLVSLMKRTRTFDKIVEKPMMLVQKGLEPKKGESTPVRLFKKVAGPSLAAGVQMLVEYPCQVVMYRMASDTTSATFSEALVRALGMADGAGVAGLQTLYMGYDITVYGAVGSALVMVLGEATGSEGLNTVTQAVGGLVSLCTDGLALRMVCSQTWSPFAAYDNAVALEGKWWVFRGLPLLVAENIAPVFLNGLRALAVRAIFADVLDEAQAAQQKHLEDMLAQFKAMKEQQEIHQQQQQQQGGNNGPQVVELPDDTPKDKNA